MPKESPLDIPMFEGKLGEDHSNNIKTFHIWCSSNNTMDASIILRLFQCILMSVMDTWYIDLKGGSYYVGLALEFLNHFQLCRE